MNQPEIVLSDQNLPGYKEAPAVAGYAWVILFVVFLAGVVAPLNQAKVPPLMPILMKVFQLNLTMAGMLMSLFAVTGFILALPAGFILPRLGPKIIGLTAIGCVIGGAVLGAISNTAGLLLISRGIEGIGMGLITVVAPVVIAMWFPAEARGAPMGIWAAWVPAGTFIMFTLAPPLGTSLGWRAVWWTGAAFALIAFVLYWLLMRLPSASATPPDSLAAPDTESLPDLRQALANRNIWLLGLEFACFTFVLPLVSVFMPTFLTAERGYSLAGASFIASFSLPFTIAAAPVSGWISDRIGSRKLVYNIPMIIVAVMWLFPFRLDGWLLLAFMAVLGILAGAIATATFAAVAEVMVKPQLAGIGMAVLAMGQNLGMFIGPAVFGYFVEATDWVTAGYLLIPVSIVGVIAGWLVKVR